MRALLAWTIIAAPAFGASAAYANVTIQPGMWELHSVVTAVDMPGAPPQMLQMMKKPQTMRHCITPEQASKGPQALLEQSRGECKFTKYDFRAGRVSAIMQCASRERGQMTVTTDGSFSPASYATTSTMVMTGPQEKMSMASTGTGKRLGPCNSKE